MKWFWVPLGVTLLACTGCGRQDASAPDRHSSVRNVSSRAPADQPLRNPFPTASDVRLFVETDHDDKGNLIFSKPEGRSLTASQRTAFESLINIHTISSDEMFAACFIPHHFFRYYDKSGKMIGELQVCFCCAGVEQSGASNIYLGEDQMLSADFHKLEAFVRSLGERTDVQCDEPS
jgi:hypothetical protein